MIQAPVSNYGMSQVATQPQQRKPQMAPSYNAVQINLDTPTLNAPPAMPYYPPVNMTTPQPQTPVAPQAPTADVPPPAVNNVNVQPPTAEGPEDIANRAFKGLSSNDFDEQAVVMEEIAKKGLPEDGKPVNTDELVPYVQENIVDRLTEIMNVDSSHLAGPTDQQIDLRKKVAANRQAKAEAEAKGQDPNGVKLPFELSAEDVATAESLSPFEKAERNKEYALYTTAILQKTYADTIQKAGDPVPPLTELPGSRAVVTQLKSNPSPDIKIAAIEAVKHVAKGQPEYKNDATTLFTIAQTDADQEVAAAATQALDIINGGQK